MFDHAWQECPVSMDEGDCWKDSRSPAPSTTTCPICNGGLEEVTEWVICDTCDWTNDPDGDYWTWHCTGCGSPQSTSYNRCIWIANETYCVDCGEAYFEMLAGEEN